MPTIELDEETIERPDGLRIEDESPEERTTSYHRLRGREANAVPGWRLAGLVRTPFGAFADIGPAALLFEELL